MMGVYLLGWYHAVNTPLPYSQWTSEKKKKKKKKKKKTTRKEKTKQNKNEHPKVVVYVNFPGVGFNVCLLGVASQSQKAITN